MANFATNRKNLSENGIKAKESRTKTYQETDFCLSTWILQHLSMAYPAPLIPKPTNSPFWLSLFELIFCHLQQKITNNKSYI